MREQAVAELEFHEYRWARHNLLWRLRAIKSLQREAAYVYDRSLRVGLPTRIVKVLQTTSAELYADARELYGAYRETEEWASMIADRSFP